MNLIAPIDPEPACASLLVPKERQTKKYSSIEPPRNSLYNMKNQHQLRKIAEGLEGLKLNRVVISDNNNLSSSNNHVTNNTVFSPSPEPKRISINGNFNKLANQT